MIHLIEAKVNQSRALFASIGLENVSSFDAGCYKPEQKESYCLMCSLLRRQMQSPQVLGAKDARPPDNVESMIFFGRDDDVIASKKGLWKNPAYKRIFERWFNEIDWKRSTQ